MNQYTDFFSSCAVVAPAKTGTPLQIKKITNFYELIKEFGDETEEYWLTSIAKILFLNNVKTIYCIAPSVGAEPTAEDFGKAFEILKYSTGFHKIICASNNAEIISALVKSTNDYSCSPKLIFAGTPDVDDAELQNFLNKVEAPNLILTNIKSVPATNTSLKSSIFSAAALAAMVANTKLPIKNLVGKLINGIILENEYIDDKNTSVFAKNSLSIISNIKDKPAVLKVVPSKPISPEIPPDLNINLILDLISISVVDLINGIKKSSAFKFVSHRSLVTQVVLLLSSFKKLGLILNYEMPKISCSSTIDITFSIKPASLLDYPYISRTIAC